MGSVISLPFTVFGTCCGSLSASLCTSFIFKMCCTSFVTSSKLSSIFYYLIFAFFASCSLITEYKGGDIVLGTTKIYIKSYDSCYDKYNGGIVLCCADKCSGKISVYRFSFAMLLFFISLSVCTFKKTNLGSKIHNGYWPLKILYILLLVILTVALENHIFIVYRDISRYISFLFLCLQIVLLIDSAYKCNDKLLVLDENHDRKIKWKHVTVIISCILYTVCICVYISIYKNHTNVLRNTDNTKNIITTITLCANFLLTLISISRIAPHGTIITSSVVTVYTTYLCYSALLSYSQTSSHEKTSDLLVGTTITSLSLISLSWNMTESKDALLGNQTLLEDDSKKDNKNWSYFHIMMSVCAIYTSMLLTNWSYDTSTENNNVQSFWIKILSQWLCFVLYGWTLLAPYLLKNYRDFGVSFD